MDPVLAAAGSRGAGNSNPPDRYPGVLERRHVGAGHRGLDCHAIRNETTPEDLGLGRLGEKRAYLWAWLLPIGLAHRHRCAHIPFHPGELDLSFPAFKQAMAAAPGGSALPTGLIVAIQIAISFTLGPLINTLFALGEELGWRGFLLPSLLPLGQWRAILMSGLIWGVWHAPAILQGHNYPSQPVLGVL